MKTNKKLFEMMLEARRLAALEEVEKRQRASAPSRRPSLARGPSLSDRIRLAVSGLAQWMHGHHPAWRRSH